MANGRKPTRRQKEVIRKYRLNCDNWLVQKNPPGELHLIHRFTNSKRVILSKMAAGG